MPRPNGREDIYRYPITDDEAASRAAYLAVAEAKDCDPLALPPIGRTISTDDVDALVDGATAGDEFSCTFEYAGCSVTITVDEVCVDVH